MIDNDTFWNNFYKSGSIVDYLKYRQIKLKDIQINDKGDVVDRGIDEGFGSSNS